MSIHISKRGFRAASSGTRTLTSDLIFLNFRVISVIENSCSISIILLFHASVCASGHENLRIKECADGQHRRADLKGDQGDRG